jgi:hypothetical protein
MAIDQNISLVLAILDPAINCATPRSSETDGPILIARKVMLESGPRQ